MDCQAKLPCSLWCRHSVNFDVVSEQNATSALCLGRLIISIIIIITISPSTDCNSMYIWYRRESGKT